MVEQDLQLLFFACLGVGLLLDALIPLHRLSLARWFRWTGNALLYLLNGLLVRLVVPGGVLAVAGWAQDARWGLFQWLDVMPWLELPAGVLLLDLLTYWLHRAFHRLPLLWRLHRLHHSDIDVDVTTELRHHPLEFAMITAVAAATVVIAGIGPHSVLLFYALTIPVSMFSHGNWLLPNRLDRWLRMVIVTPGMHRIHHSAWQPETDSNYGVLFAFWDRLFGSYRAAPKASYRDMTMGLERFRDPAAQLPHRLLLNPLD